MNLIKKMHFVGDSISEGDRVFIRVYSDYSGDEYSEGVIVAISYETLSTAGEAKTVRRYIVRVGKDYYQLSEEEVYFLP